MHAACACSRPSTHTRTCASLITRALLLWRTVRYPPCTMLKVMEASERIATAPAAAPAAAPTARARAKTIDASRYEWKDVSEEGKKFRVISVLPTFL